jgi:hypothetical protein
LEFTSVALRRSINNEDEELTVSFTEAYGVTLRPFHGIVVRPIFSVCSVIFILSNMHTYVFCVYIKKHFFFLLIIKLAMKACPYRKDFFEKLGEDQEKVKQQYEEWLLAFEKVVVRLNNFYIEGGYDKGKF